MVRQGIAENVLLTGTYHPRRALWPAVVRALSFLIVRQIACAASQAECSCEGRSPKIRV